METLKSHESEFKQVISNRIAHCDKQLRKNINNIDSRNEYIIHFNNGEHYSIPVIRALEDALIQNIRQWSSLVWQQIIRQLWEENNRNKNLFYIATEMLLVKDFEH